MATITDKPKTMSMTQAVDAGIKAVTAGLILGFYAGSGVGKSSVWAQIAKSLSYDYEVMFGATREAVDFGGFPCKFTDAEGNTYMMMVPAHQLHKMLTTKVPLLVLFDEIDKCTQEVKNAIAQLILDRRVNGELISPFVRFAFAGNRMEDKCNSTPLPDHLKKRHCIIHVEPDIKSWKDWALKNGVMMEVIGYFGLKPEMLFAGKPTRELANTCNPRSAEYLSDAMKAGLILTNYNQPNEELTSYASQIATGFVGQETASEFLSFLEVRNRLPSVDQIILNPTGAPLPDGPDISYMITGALTARLKSDPQVIGQCIEYTKRMTEDFKVMFAKYASVEVPEVNQNREFNKYLCDIESL